jgi:CRISPR-associated protein Csb2
MTLTLKIWFLAGRYHATDWNHQVNEGVLEWPPSPWRLYRTFVFSYYRLPERPERSVLLGLLETLSSVLPDYYLPPITEGHTRHYMPVWKEGENRTTLVFDTFLALGQGAFSEDAVVWMTWPGLALSESHHRLLAQLCERISYLGRAESWAELSIQDQPSLGGQKAFPLLEAVGGTGTHTVKVLVPMQEELAKLKSQTLPPPKRGKARYKIPQDILSALELDIGDWHRQGWSGIPGARWVPYVLDEPPRQRKYPASKGFSLAGEPAFARFTLSGNVLPKLTRALSIGERFREALMSWSNGHVLFSGRDPENLDDTGNPLPVQGHPHCWYLSEDVDGDGFIDHVLVYAAKGFDEKALKALRDLKKVWSNETSEGELQTILIQLGRVKDYATTLESRIPGVSPLIAKATTWRSLTPMVLPRHFKRNPKLDPASQLLIDSPEHQVLSQIRCLRKHDLLKFSEPPGWTWKNHILVTQEGFDGLYPWYAYQRLRQKGNGSHAGNKAYWVEITFPEAIVGPLALGYAAHFGLGVFMPCLKKWQTTSEVLSADEKIG